MGWTKLGTIEQAISRLRSGPEVIKAHVVQEYLPQGSMYVAYAVVESEIKGQTIRNARVTLFFNDGLVKNIDETLHPFYFNFPKTWLAELSPPMNEDSAKWREEVTKRSAFEEGETYSA